MDDTLRFASMYTAYWHLAARCDLLHTITDPLQFRAEYTSIESQIHEHICDYPLLPDLAMTFTQLSARVQTIVSTRQLDRDVHLGER
ncbi:MAG: hypothetical protein GFH27_549293n139 [Chloroflexi bacterium AL-W]|nr:hypothetical protein [Chloroflexi bacterium AL-N1]NOK67746.1 hypothetical protein [Chloroflexi bacterium AL-N10]NOK75484.1 hypothetical protein [Chloroflexi bacterium AL-N5]NOK82272.1 hypothetical protein [Chloroflexi bacterium AL-W]NOK90117.1 hypothetical protein [Chloroflexi bacterium AL-N15]